MVKSGWPFANTAYDIQWTFDEAPRTAPGAFQCDMCDKVFADHHALCTHVYKCHQVLNIAHRYALSHRCRGCLKQYHSREEVIHHLKYYRTGCLVKLILTVPPATDVELNELLAEGRYAQQQRSTTASCAA